MFGRISSKVIRARIFLCGNIFNKNLIFKMYAELFRLLTLLNVLCVLESMNILLLLFYKGQVK